MAVAQQTMLDPKENRIGNIVPWTPGNYVCPFCGSSTLGSSCGFNGDYAVINGVKDSTKILMNGVCKKVAAAPASTTTVNPNGPHNNIIGAKYIQTGNPGCKFCGEANIAPDGRGGATWACGGNVTGSPDYIVKAICTRTPSGMKVSPLAAAVAPAKPLINCPSCGAYAADKHRRGCAKKSANLTGD